MYKVALKSIVSKWGLEPSVQAGLVVGAGVWPGEGLAGAGELGVRRLFGCVVVETGWPCGFQLVA